MQAITTKFIAPTNTKGERVQVKSWLGTTYHAWDDSTGIRSNHVGAVQEHLVRKIKDFTTGATKPVAIGELHDTSGYCVIVNNSPVFNYDEEWEALHRF